MHKPSQAWAAHASITEYPTGYGLLLRERWGSGEVRGMRGQGSAATKRAVEQMFGGLNLGNTGQRLVQDESIKRIWQEVLAKASSPSLKKRRHSKKR